MRIASIQRVVRRLSAMAGTTLLVKLATLPCSAALHTYEGGDSIDRIRAVAIYFVPNDRQPLADWRERITFFARRAEAFHDREFAGQSRLAVVLPERPFIAQSASAAYEHPDANRTYFRVMDEVRAAVPTDRTNGFPILMVFADLNHCPYDDWTRECVNPNCACPGHPQACRGYVASDGIEFPGSPCGGARAMYWRPERFGAGLITADGWKVPVKGSDSVVYHEGIGHCIGLPHPSPMNDSVMGTAQYRWSLHETWLDRNQKQALGWKEVTVPRTNLFSLLRVWHEPNRPNVGDDIALWVSLTNVLGQVAVGAEIQLRPEGEWKVLPACEPTESGGHLRWRFVAPAMDSPSPIAYRVRAATEEMATEIWRYLRVVDGASVQGGVLKKTAD